MAFWDRKNDDYKPWDWNPDRDDPDKNGKNKREDWERSDDESFWDKQEKSDFEWSEIENRISPEMISKGIKEHKEIRDEYERQTKGMGTNLMMLQLTNWKFAGNNDQAKNMMKLANKLNERGMKLMDEDRIKEILDTNKRNDDSVNMSAMVSFGVALTNHCVDKGVERVILREFEEQKKFFKNKGEMDYMAFLTSVETMKYFVEEQWLKEQVYKEIDELEKTPVPKEKK